MPLFKLSAAKLDDAQAINKLIIPLVEEFISHEYTEQGNVFVLSSMSEENIRVNIDKGFEYFIAKDDQRVVGVLAIKESNHLYHCFVDKNYHRQKIGEQLWNYWLSDTKAEEVTVNSSKYAIKFYESLGFIYSGEVFEKNGIVSYPMIFKRSFKD